MTKYVSISITFTIENEKGNKLYFKLSPGTLGDDLKYIQQSLMAAISPAILMHLDDQIKETEMKGMKVLGTEKRTVVTEVGAIEINRRVYRSADGKRVKPLDELLGIAPYERRNRHVQETESVIAARSAYRSAAMISTMMTGVYVSPTTIGRDVRRVGGRIAESDQAFSTEDKGKIISDVLYGESDGILIRLQKDTEGKKYAEIKTAIAYTGKVRLSGHRKQLENKLTLAAVDVSSLQWQEMIRNHLYGRYDLDAVKLMAVGGDGGSWVGSSFDLCGIRRIERVLDPFHIKKYVRTAFGDSLPLNELYNVLFHEGFDAVCDQLLPLLSKGNQSIRKARRDCYNYLSHHQNEILPLSDRSLPFERLGTMGCIESNVGKTIALRMKTRGCSWSRAGAKAMAAVLCHLPQLEQHSFKVEEFRPTKKKYHSRTPASQKIISNATIHQASFPIVKIGKTSVPLYHLFRNIISPKELP